MDFLISNTRLLIFNKMEIINQSNFADITAEINAVKSEKENKIDLKLAMEYDNTLQSQITALEYAICVMIWSNITEGRQVLEENLGELRYKLWMQNTNIEEIEADYDQQIELLENDREDILHMIADTVGLDRLIEMRRNVGKAMSKQYCLQKEHYDLQKERYETCKKNKYFLVTDREYITYHKQLNKEHIDEWERLRIERETLCQLIQTIDPNDQDIGFDEDADL